MKTRPVNRWRTFVGTPMAVVLLATACSGADVSAAAPPTEVATSTAPEPAPAAPGPEGTYEITWTGEELVELLGFDEPWVHANAGRVRFTFADGHYAFEWLSGPSTGDVCEGTYAVTGGRLVMTGSPDPAPNDCGEEHYGVRVVDATWQRQGAALVLNDFVRADEPDLTWWMAAWMGTKPLGPSVEAAATGLRFAATGGFGDVTLGRLVEALEEASGGALRLEIAGEFDITATTRDVERRLVEAIADGELDLAFVGTRVFDDLGVPDLRALTAPMVVDSLELQRAVLTSGLPDQMLEAVGELGVAGLGVVGGPFRRPGSTTAPLLRPSDFEGSTFHVFSSGAGEEALAALGATPTNVAPEERDAGLQDGTIEGLENALDLIAGRPYVRFVTANVALWPSTGVVLANPDTLADLDPRHRGWLEEAVDRTVEASIDEPAFDEAQLFGIICEQGGSVVEASADDLAALRAAFAPVLARLAEDPATAAHLAEIERLRAAATPDALELPASCLGG